jgi:hypothetical protein
MITTQTMPGDWCTQCSRYVPVEELKEGNCPTCGTHLRDQHAPWHFKLLIVALSVYLTWRFIQGIFWVIHHVH